jgi:hypothetical protein
MGPNPYQSPEAQPHEQRLDWPQRSRPADARRYAAVGSVLGVIIAARVLHQPFGMGGGGNLEDAALVASALIGGCLGYWLGTMRLSPFSRS